MDFVDLQFPPRIALGAMRKAGWSTTIVQVQGGSETANQNWANARHEFDVSMAVRDEVDFDEVVQHFHSMRGRARKFPFRDALDYRVEASRGVLLDDGESPSVAFHLAKRYGTSGYTYDRTITRPKSGTVAIYRLRSGVTDDITGDATISYTTGAVTLTIGTYQGGDILSWAGQFYVPCRYDVDKLPAATVNKRKGDGRYLVQCDSIPVVEVKE